MGRLPYASVQMCSLSLVILQFKLSWLIGFHAQEKMEWAWFSKPPVCQRQSNFDPLCFVNAKVNLTHPSNSFWFCSLVCCVYFQRIGHSTSHLLAFQPVTLTIDLYNVAVVKQPVQQCRGQGCVICKCTGPLWEWQVTGHDDAACFIPLCNHIKKQVGFFPTERQVANLINSRSWNIRSSRMNSGANAEIGNWDFDLPRLFQSSVT